MAATNSSYKRECRRSIADGRCAYDLRWSPLPENESPNEASNSTEEGSGTLAPVVIDADSRSGIALNSMYRLRVPVGAESKESTRSIACTRRRRRPDRIGVSGRLDDGGL